MSFLLASAVFFLVPAVDGYQGNAEESILHLSSFPEGKYDSFTHLYCDFEGLEKKGNHSLTSYIRREISLYLNSAPLPPSLKKKIRFLTCGTKSHYVLMTDENSEELKREISGDLKPDRRRPLSVYIKKEDGESEKIEFATLTDDLWVFTLTDAGLSIHNALKSGEISPIDTKLHDVPFYSFTMKDSRQYYLCASPAGVLLVTKKLPLLKEMLETSMGQSNSIVDSKSWKRLMEFQPEFDLAWFYLGGPVVQEFRTQIAKEHGAAESQITEMDEWLVRMPEFQVRYLTLTDNLVEKTISVYANEEAAEAECKRLDAMYRRNLDAMLKMKEGDDQQKRLGAAYMLQQIKRTTYETKDTQLIHTKYLDEQAVESYRKALEAEKKESEDKK